MENSNSLIITIKRRDGILVQGDDFFALSSTNERGVFDILPQHANFITMVKEKVILHKKDGTKQEIPLKSGVLHVTNNVIEVYIDIINPTPE